MKKNALFFALVISFCIKLSAQELYSSINEFGNRFNPGFSKGGTPNVLFDDVSIANSLIAGSDSVIITKVKVGIRRTPNAPATNVQVYYTIYNETSTLIKIPPVLLGTVSLPANGPSLITEVVAVGDSVSTLFKVKTDTGAVYPGFQTLFIGASLSNSSIENGMRFTSGPAINKDIMWIYNSDSTGSVVATNFNGSPPAKFYIQVFGKMSSILPILLLHFSGEQKETENFLTWTTESETNNKGFEIQRSADGTVFTPIAFVNSKAYNGNSSAALTYDYSDAEPFANNTYYKLKQVDKDGHSVFSNIVHLKRQKVNGISFTNVYPNPAKSILKAVLASPVSEKVSIIVTDFAGRILLRQSSKLLVGDNSIPINVAMLPAGNYVIKAVDLSGNTAVIRHFIKQ